MVMFVIPFTTFYYEGEDISDIMGTNETKNNSRSRFCSALCYSLVFMLTFLGVLLGLYFASNSIDIPVKQYSFSLENAPVDKFVDNINIYVPIQRFNHHAKISDSAISFSVNFQTYVVGLFGWIGWFLFSIFAGLGLTSMPFDLICAFIWRPRPMKKDELNSKVAEIQDRTAEILEICTLLKQERTLLRHGSSSADKRKRMVTDRVEINRLTQMVYVLERDAGEIRACREANKEYNPLIPYAKLICGIFFAIVSFFWLLQIMLYMIPNPPKSTFLNAFLTSFNSWFPMFGVIVYALFSLYLLFCTIAGCFKFGMRFMCIKIHPMEAGSTYTNSFLFNVGIILLCTIPVVQFCVQALSQYAQNTDAFLLFGVQVDYLSFFAVFYRKNIFVWIILLGAFLSLVYLVVRPRDLAASTEEFKSTLYRRGAQTGYKKLGKSDKI